LQFIRKSNMESLMLISDLARLPSVSDYSEEDRLVLWAVRHSVRAAAAGREARRSLMHALSPLVGTRGVDAILLFVQAVGAAWPDPLQIGCPCQRSLVSPDEYTILAMIAAARRDDFVDHNRLLTDLLPLCARTRLFHYARKVADESVVQ
jgi:hypothetical protein